jgi:hypothetical protein
VELIRTCGCFTGFSDGGLIRRQAAYVVEKLAWKKSGFWRI